MNLSNSTRNNETSTSHGVAAFSVPVRTAITLWSILLVLSLLGNVLVIAVVCRNHKLRTSINYLIVNMAVSDLLVPFITMSYFITLNVADGEWLVEGSLGEALCKLVHFISDIPPFVSSISMVIIAFLRFMAVVYPARRQMLSRKKRWIAVSVPWIVAMALFSPYFYTFRLTNEWGYKTCVHSWSPAFDDYWTSELILTSIDFMVGFVIPLIVIVVLYSITVYELRRSLNNVMDLVEKEMIRSRQRRNRRIFSMLITIVVMFVICWCPFVVLHLLKVTRSSFWSMDVDTRDKMLFASLYMWYLVAIINPCIYFMFLGDFRQELKSLCCRTPASANDPIPGRLRKPGEDHRNQHVHHFTSIPLQSRMNINLNRCIRTPGGDSNQDSTCTPPHIITTSLQISRVEFVNR